MTFIIDMASGTEYQGEEMRCKPRAAAATRQVTLAPHEQLDLRLETVEASATARDSSRLPEGMQIDALIQSLED